MRTYDFKANGQGQTSIKEEVLTTSREKNHPVAKFRCGGVTATVWQNEYSTPENTFSTQTVAISRSYKTKEEWKTSNSYKIGDLQKLRRVLDLAEAFVLDAHEETDTHGGEE